MSVRDSSAVRDELLEQGIVWSSLVYHSRPKILSTLYDVFVGALFIVREFRKHRFDILHARAFVPAVMAHLARFAGRLNTKILFDLRGLIIEEYLDAGVLSRSNPLSPLMRSMELRTLDAADGVVVLTDAIRSELFADSSHARPIERIPCCFDDRKFIFPTELQRLDSKKRLGLENRLVGIYTGSVSGVYLVDEMCKVFARFRDLNTQFFPIVLSRGDFNEVKQKMEQNGFGEDEFIVTSVEPAKVGDYLAASDFAVAFYSATFSRLATSPTKNAEYLAMGLPILTNAGIGDTEKELIEDRTGVVLREFDQESIDSAVEDIIRVLSEGEQVRMRCRASAEKRYSLENVGGPAYRRIYRRVSGEIR
jgi:glycosyltransferase involved in cell wall biosynthesis